MSRHMVIGSVKVKPDNRPTMESVADRGEPMMTQLPGFQNVTFYLDEDRSEYGAVSVWESREAAENAAETTTPQFQEAVGDAAEGSIETHIYEVYEPQH